MAKRIFQAVNFTPTATADTTAMANSTYMAMKGGSATQMIEVQEIMVSGFAAASAPTILQFARSSTVATTPTALAAPNSDGPMHPSTAALAAVPVTFVAAAAGTQRDATTTSARLNMGLNAFGGIVRWVAAQGAPFTILSATAPLGESSLSAFTGGTVGAISAHIIYEPY
jgi:hypothetical protein